MGTYPPVSHVAHRQRLAALDPGHEGAIKLECASALIRQEPSNFLRAPVVFVQRGASGDRPCVPVNAHFPIPVRRHEQRAYPRRR